ncbi:MAG: tetratricopeptide repeat protein [Planctomycetes bacterium]|nr:tetratricopeptide repeat protein [Planctomycetota bacterium]
MPPNGPLSRFADARVVLGALLLLAAIAYAPVVECGFVWDDDDYVTQNPVLRSWGGLLSIWFEPRSLPQYYPLVHTTFWLEYRLWGLAPFGYHAVNVLLHAAAAFQLWRLCRQLDLRVALVPAVWFLVHPVHVESVAWVTERKNVLSLLCALWAARQWLAWHDIGGAGHYRLGCLGFAAALASKTVTASLPAALLVVLWWRDGTVARRAWRGALPWLVVGVAAGWFTAHLEATHVLAVDARWHLTWPERFLVAGRAPWFYLGCLVWPWDLCFNYPRWQLDVGSIAAWAWPAATALAVAGAVALRRRWTRGPAAVLLLFGGLLVPALGFVDVYPFRYSFVADHFQYHASVPVLVGLAAAVVPRALAAWPFRGVVALAALGLAANVALTALQTLAYRDLDALWQHTLARNPDSALALANLGGLANLRGDFAAAKDYSERAVAIDPGSHEAWNNLGTLAHRAGDRTRAREHYDRALRCRPGDAAASLNLARLELDEARPAVAVRFAEQALREQPEFLEAHGVLAQACVDAQLWAKGLAAADFVLQRVPGDLAARRAAVRCLQVLGRHPEAATNALVWLRVQPGDAAAAQAVVVSTAQVLRAAPPERAAALWSGACAKNGIDPAALSPRLEQELRRLGANTHADNLQRASAGR